jgi:hypothetical protein
MSCDPDEGNPFVNDFIRQNLIRQLEDLEEERWIETASWIVWARTNFDNIDPRVYEEFG